MQRTQSRSKGNPPLRQFAAYLGTMKLSPATAAAYVKAVRRCLRELKAEESGSPAPEHLRRYDESLSVFQRDTFRGAWKWWVAYVRECGWTVAEAPSRNSQQRGDQHGA